jgi:GTP-binding protein
VRPRKSQLEIKEAEFLFGAPSAENIRKQSFPEIAVIGRSNVGKSSFVNRLVNGQVAKVSATPGCTRQINFFRVRGELVGVKFQVSLVDLPGFGFAKLSKTEREQIGRSAISYLRDREQLRAVLLLNDCRREPQRDELAIQDTCGRSGVSCLIVLTKMDTLKQNEKAKATAKVAKAYRLEPGDVLHAGEDLLVDPVWDRILTVIE